MASPDTSRPAQRAQTSLILTEENRRAMVGNLMQRNTMFDYFLNVRYSRDVHDDSVVFEQVQGTCEDALRSRRRNILL